MPFLPPNQQCQSTEGTNSVKALIANNNIENMDLNTPLSPRDPAHPVHGSLRPASPHLQTASRLWFVLHSLYSWPADRQTQTQRPRYVCNSMSHIMPCMAMRPIKVIVDTRLQPRCCPSPPGKWLLAYALFQSRRVCPAIMCKHDVINKTGST